MPKQEANPTHGPVQRASIYREAMGSLVSAAGGRLRVTIASTPGAQLHYTIDKDEAGRSVVDFVLISPRRK